MQEETETKVETETEKEKVAPKKQGALIRYAVLFGIVILINLFVTYAIQVVYPEPEYDQFCKMDQVNQVYEDKQTCVDNGGQWNEAMGEGVTKQEAYCNNNFTCSQDFDAATSIFSRNVFIVFVVVGLLLLVGSLFIPGSSLITQALSLAGVLALIIGSLSYWSDMNDILRLIVLGVALVTILYFAWKKFED
ncbi:MAG: hypothetical protein KIH67_000320 [Candidatus Moranbacteria bacterium]|nr:hypothetical protein [Candidatus Moranbacteria bacterium]